VTVISGAECDVLCISHGRVGWLSGLLCNRMQVQSLVGDSQSDSDNKLQLLLCDYIIHLVNLPSVLWHCWLGGRKGTRPVKNMGDGGSGHWLVQMEWRPAGWSVCLPLIISPCTISPEVLFWHRLDRVVPEKRAVKRLWCVWYTLSKSCLNTLD